MRNRAIRNVSLLAAGLSLGLALDDASAQERAPLQSGKPICNDCISIEGNLVKVPSTGILGSSSAAIFLKVTSPSDWTIQPGAVLELRRGTSAKKAVPLALLPTCSTSSCTLTLTSSQLGPVFGDPATWTSPMPTASVTVTALFVTGTNITTKQTTPIKVKGVAPRF